MDISIKELKDLGTDKWVEFCDNNSNCWVHHKGAGFLNNKESLSFVIKEGNRIIALCPFVVEEKKYNGENFKIGSLFGLSIPGPVIADAAEGKDYCKKIRNLIYDTVQKKSTQENIAKVTFNYSSFLYGKGSVVPLLNELSRYGFLDASLKMILFDLELKENEAWKNLSKGHRSILKKFLDISRCEYLNYENAKLELQEFSAIMLTIEDFTEPYLRYLFELYKQGNAEICHLIFESKVAGSAFFLKYHNTVQYHEAERFTKEDIPVHHLIVWKSMEKFRQEKYRFMNFGVFSYKSQLNYAVSEKAAAISVFKRGFGGKVLPFVLGEKYFNRSYFELEYNDRISKYKETMINE